MKLVINTNMDVDDIAKIIIQSDEELDTRLNGATMSATNKKRCSSLMTAIVIAESMPESYTVGSTRISFGSRIRRWEARVDALVDTATASAAVIVKSSTYQKIVEDSRYR